MNTCIRFAPSKQPAPLQGNFSGVISAANDDGSWLIDEHFSAWQATSLLIKPAVGDTVAYVAVAERYFIVHILQRTEGSENLEISTQQPLSIRAPQLDLLGWESIQLTSLQTISTACQHHALTASGSLVQQAHDVIQQAQHVTQTTTGIARHSAQQHIITASDDVQIDGKRINMG